jgi:hypothetical protein
MVSPVAEIVSKPIPRMIDFDVDTVISIPIPVNFTRYRWQNDLRLLYGVIKDKARRTPPKRSQALIHPTADPPITTYLEHHAQTILHDRFRHPSRISPRGE